MPIAANNTAGTDFVGFNIGPGGLQTIAVGPAALPTITDTIILDATTQIGYAGNPLIQLDGSATTGGTNGAVDGLFAGGGAGLLLDQAIGGIAIAAFVAAASLVLFGSLKSAGMLRVSLEEEIGGLDLSEHGTAAYGWDVDARRIRSRNDGSLVASD